MGRLGPDGLVVRKAGCPVIRPVCGYGWCVSWEKGQGRLSARGDVFGAVCSDRLNLVFHGWLILH